MNDQQVDSLIKWLDTFELEARHTSIEEISDGAAIAEALEQIAPEWFTAAWRSKIKLDVGNNWRLKISNLKKIIEAVMEYYVECLNQPLSGYAKPDATKIGELTDADELRRLLQLVLGCAVNCDRKQHYITLIMSMEESVQRAIMQSIQELEGSMHGPKLSLGASLNLDSCDSGGGGGIAMEGRTDVTQRRLLAELQMAHDLKDQLGQRCHELDLQLSLLQEEKASLMSENKKLQQRLDEFDLNDDNVSSVAGGSSSVVYATLRKQVEELKDEIFKIETSRDDYRLKVELMEKEILELQSRHEELQRTADETNNLKDEIDALRETADKAAKYESTIESYKKKMEDMSDLRRQVKILEEKNMEHVESRIALEEESKRATLVRNHLEVCKQQLAECHRRLDEQSNKCDKLEFEARKSEARISSLQRERDRLVMERDALRETNEELRCTQARGIEKIGIAVDCDGGADTSGNELVPPHEWREKILLLQHEIKMLRLNETGSDDKLPTVQALLEDSEERLNALRGQNRNANQRIIELENKIEEITENRACDETKNENSAILQQRLVELQDELKKSNAEREQLVAHIEERDATVVNQKQKIFSLQENLTRKEIECNALDERYRKYIEKAKSVIRSLDPKQSNSSPSEIVLLRNQIMEKRKIIEDMERSMKESKLLREMEEKMMTTAFYHLGFTCQREAVDQHLSALSSSQGHSFLARQRQPAARRNVHPSYNLEYVQ